jgi:hypothetical protein
MKIFSSDVSPPLFFFVPYKPPEIHGAPHASTNLASPTFFALKNRFSNPSCAPHLNQLQNSLNRTPHFNFLCKQNKCGSSLSS